MSLETAFNKRAWRKIAPQAIGAGMVLPTEFHFSNDFAGLARIKDNPQLTFAVVPVGLPEPARAYTDSLTVADIESFPAYRNNEQARARLPLAGYHSYAEREFRPEVDAQRRRADNRTDDMILGMQGYMHTFLPDRTGKAELMQNVAQQLKAASELFGELAICRLSFSEGWMPHPSRLRPHHDVATLSEEERYRYFAVLGGMGPLAVPTPALPANRRFMKADGPDDFEDSSSDSGYPSFADIDRKNIYQLGHGHAGVWRSGRRVVATETRRPLPHAVPPFSAPNGGLRTILVADFRAS